MNLCNHAKYQLFLSDFNENCTFSTLFRKILKYHHLTQIRPVAVEFTYADGRTEKHDEVNIAFHNIADAPKNSTFVFFFFNFLLKRVLVLLFSGCWKCNKAWRRGFNSGQAPLALPILHKLRFTLCTENCLARLHFLSVRVHCLTQAVLKLAHFRAEG